MNLLLDLSVQTSPVQWLVRTVQGSDAFRRPSHMLELLRTVREMTGDRSFSVCVDLEEVLVSQLLS